jgi:transposase
MVPPSAYATRVLAPSLRPGQVVVLDNLSAHKGTDARTAVEAVGCRLLFLPAYSPDFNPIELAFAKVKERLRAAAERTPVGLLAATAAAIDAVTVADARACYAPCGFPLPAD